MGAGIFLYYINFRLRKWLNVKRQESIKLTTKMKTINTVE